MTNKNISQVRFIEKSNSLLVRAPDGNNWFLNLNLVLYAAGIPYTKKNGELVSTDRISEMKAENQKRYLAAIEENKKARTA